MIILFGPLQPTVPVCHCKFITASFTAAAAATALRILFHVIKPLRIIRPRAAERATGKLGALLMELAAAKASFGSIRGIERVTRISIQSSLFNEIFRLVDCL